MPLWVFIFSSPMFSYTSLNILNVLLTSLLSPPSLVAPFGALIHTLLCCVFAIVGRATTPQFYHGFFFPILHSEHKIFFSPIFLLLIVLFLSHLTYSTLHPPSSFLCFHASKQFIHHKFLSCFPEINPCSRFSSVLVPLYSHPPHSTNITIFFLVFHPLSSNATPFGGMPCTPLCSCTFFCRECTSFFFCCIFCGLATHATLSSTPHCITQLFNISNLFWEIAFPISSPPLFLQFWARCLNFLQLKHSFFFLPSSSFLSLARDCFCLSILLRIELYCLET